MLAWRLTFSWEPAEVASGSGTTGTAPFVCWPGGKAALLCSAVPVSRGLRACGISTLFTWKTWCLWFSTSVFPGWWHQSKGLCDLTVSAAFTCELGTQRAAPLAPIYSVEREQKGTGSPRVTQQRCRQLFAVHSLLHQALEFLFSLVSCCCVIFWSFIKKQNKTTEVQRPCTLSKRN